MDADVDDEGITWRELVFELLASLLYIEGSLDGPSSYAKRQNLC